MAAINRSRVGRYVLYAYVCGAGCVQMADVEGTVTFTQIFMKRPSECRYAVVGYWDVVEHKERVLVWDMFDSRINTTGSKVFPPLPVRVCDDVDQAIMATLMLYDQERDNG